MPKLYHAYGDEYGYGGENSPPQRDAGINSMLNAQANWYAISWVF